MFHLIFVEKKWRNKDGFLLNVILLWRAAKTFARQNGKIMANIKIKAKKYFSQYIQMQAKRLKTKKNWCTRAAKNCLAWTETATDSLELCTQSIAKWGVYSYARGTRKEVIKCSLFGTFFCARSVFLFCSDSASFDSSIALRAWTSFECPICLCGWACVFF